MDEGSMAKQFLKRNGVVLICLAILVVVLGIKIGSCVENAERPRRMEVVETYLDGWLLADKETSVLYFQSDTGISVVLNEDGTPQVLGGRIDS